MILCRAHIRGDWRRIAISTEKAPADRISMITQLLITHKGVCDVLSTPSSTHLIVGDQWKDKASDIGIKSVYMIGA
eukprot:scaffold12928_cov64-Cyclotella_meneghiniana.AAC.9